MIGRLPVELEINGNVYRIRSDYRDCLNIFEAYSDPECTKSEQMYIALYIFYVDFDQMPESDYEEAYKQMLWFLNVGDTVTENQKKEVKLMDWEQDQSIYFPAVNKVAGKEIRQESYLHFWTFMGYFNEIGEGMFSTVVGIRNKKANKKRLESHEREFYESNKNIIEIKRVYSREEMEQISVLDALTGGAISGSRRNNH